MRQYQSASWLLGSARGVGGAAARETKNPPGAMRSYRFSATSTKASLTTGST